MSCMDVVSPRWHCFRALRRATGKLGGCSLATKYSLLHRSAVPSKLLCIHCRAIVAQCAPNALITQALISVAAPSEASLVAPVTRRKLWTATSCLLLLVTCSAKGDEQISEVAVACKQAYVHPSKATHMYIYIYTHTYIYTNIHTYIHTYIHTCIYISIIYRYIRTCTCVYTYTHMYIHMYIHTNTHICTSLF